MNLSNVNKLSDNELLALAKKHFVDPAQFILAMDLKNLAMDLKNFAPEVADTLQRLHAFGAELDQIVKAKEEEKNG